MSNRFWCLPAHSPSRIRPLRETANTSGGATREWSSLLLMKNILFLVATLLPAISAGAEARVLFQSPLEGAHVKSPVEFSMAVSGMSVRPAGDMTEGTGHHHILIDHDCIPAGKLIGVGEGIHHFGKGQTEAAIPLPPGEHKVTLQFANGAHISYGPKLCTSITIHVND